MSQKLSDKLTECVGTSQPLVLIRTDEWEDAEQNISQMCQEFGWRMVLWDAKNGLQAPDGSQIRAAEKKEVNPALPAALQASVGPLRKERPHQTLLAALDSLVAYDNVSAKDARPVPIVLVLRNLHKMWAAGGGEPSDQLVLLQTLQGIVKTFKSDNKTVIGLAPPGEMPPVELVPVFDVLDHRLPVKEEFNAIVLGVEIPEELEIKLNQTQIRMIAEASCGLTRLQAEKSYATAILRLSNRLLHGDDAVLEPDTLGRFFCDTVEEEKNQILNADGMLYRWDGSEGFDDIGGNEAVKEYLKLVMQPEARRKKSKRNCCLLIGPPGTGKTMLAKALGRHTGRKTYGGNLSSNKSKWVGESEANARRMFGRASAMNNIVLYFDEINEQVESGESGGHSVDKAMRQYLLEWLDTHHRSDDVYVVMTANDISQMHMALTRSGRVDAIWYVGLPGKAQKAAIWQLCIDKYDLIAEQYAQLPDDAGWAGVEIDACCATADNFGIPLTDAAKYVIPSSIRVKEQIDRLTDWAHDRCLDAETGERFDRDRASEPVRTGSLNAAGVPVRRKVHATKRRGG